MDRRQRRYARVADRKSGRRVRRSGSAHRQCRLGDCEELESERRASRAPEKSGERKNSLRNLSRKMPMAWLQAKSPAQNRKRRWARGKEPRRPTPYERFAVINFYTAEDCGKKDCTSQPNTAAGHAKLSLRAGKFAAHPPNGQQSKQGSCDARPDIDVDEIGDRGFGKQTINPQREADRARWRSKARMNLAKPRRKIA